MGFLEPSANILLFFTSDMGCVLAEGVSGIAVSG